MRLGEEEAVVQVVALPVALLLPHRVGLLLPLPQAVAEAVGEGNKEGVDKGEVVAQGVGEEEAARPSLRGVDFKATIVIIRLSYRRRMKASVFFSL